MAEIDIVEQKLDNFKIFIKSISSNQETIDEYENMSRSKLNTYCAWILVPMRDNLKYLIDQMQQKLEFDDKHKPIVERYLKFFIDVTCGVLYDEQDEDEQNNEQNEDDEQDEQEFLNKLNNVKIE